EGEKVAHPHVPKIVARPAAGRRQEGCFADSERSSFPEALALSPAGSLALTPRAESFPGSFADFSPAAPPDPPLGADLVPGLACLSDAVAAFALPAPSDDLALLASSAARPRETEPNRMTANADAPKIPGFTEPLLLIRRARNKEVAVAVVIPDRRGFFNPIFYDPQTGKTCANQPCEGLPPLRRRRLEQRVGDRDGPGRRRGLVRRRVAVATGRGLRGRRRCRFARPVR